MRKILFWGLCVLTIGLVSAQETKELKAGDSGLLASVSSSSNSIGGVYHLTDSLVVVPEVGFGTWNNAITVNTGASKKDYPGYWFTLAVAGYYELNPFKNLYFDIGPQFYLYNRPDYKSDNSDDEMHLSYWSLNANVSPKLMLTNNFAAYSVFGIGYSSSESKNSTLGSSYVATGLHLLNAELGIIYYLR